ncbi:MAG: hypothetical protein ACQ9MH_14545 [Nitrospinales bacterium]
MEIRLNDLFQRFKTKGFMPVEIPGLVKDVFNIIGTSRYSAITTIDQELEDLGWGISIMDNVTHELITSLLEDNSSADVVSYFINHYEHHERKEDNYGRSRRN